MRVVGFMCEMWSEACPGADPASALVGGAWLT